MVRLSHSQKMEKRYNAVWMARQELHTRELIAGKPIPKNLEKMINKISFNIGGEGNIVYDVDIYGEGGFLGYLKSYLSNRIYGSVRIYPENGGRISSIVIPNYIGFKRVDMWKDGKLRVWFYYKCVEFVVEGFYPKNKLMLDINRLMGLSKQH